MPPKWQKLASLAQNICRLWFQSLVQSLLPKDTLLRTYLNSKFPYLNYSYDGSFSSLDNRVFA